MSQNETIIETKICKHCEAHFDITDQDLEFYEKVSPSFGGKKYIIPSPTLCPDCRLQRKMIWRNERKLYKRKCDATGKDIISVYSPEKPYKVYLPSIWNSDKWDPLDYGKDFDFSKGFFEQFYDFSLKIPKLALHLDISMENCNFCNYGMNSKNCYMCVAPTWSEECFYSSLSAKSLFDIDGELNIGNQYCYECINCNNCYNSQYIRYSYDCKNSFFLLDCYNCTNCFGCINLNNKEYNFFNEQLTKEEYEIKLGEITSNYSIKKKYHKEFEKFILSFPRKNLRNTNSENCTGDFILYSKECNNCFSIVQVENCKDSDSSGMQSSFLYSCFFTGVGSNYLYEGIGLSQSVKTFSCVFGRVLESCLYCINMDSCSYCFGCEGLRNKSYCILNRQYTKEEYEALVPKIIEHMSSPRPSPKGEGDGISSLSLKETSEERSACTTILKLEQSRGLGGEVEWGEFFPASLSPFGYNETVAQEYFPIPSPQPSPKGEGASETETFRKVWIPSSPSPSGEGARGGGSGFWCNWSLYEPPFPKVDKIIPAEKLPEDITKIPDDILNWAIECEVTKKPFRIIKQELDFYRKHNLPIPRRHPDQRHLDRMALRNPRKLYERLCDCAQCETNNKISTLSSSEGGSLPLGKGFSQSENDKGGVHTSREQIPHFELNPKTGTRTKKIITTYSPERKEIVYCETCYNKEVY